MICADTPSGFAGREGAVAELATELAAQVVVNTVLASIPRLVDVALLALSALMAFSIMNSEGI